MEWKAKTTTNTFANFQAFFNAHNTVVHNLDKHTRTKAKDVCFHSTNSTRVMEERLCEKMEPALKKLDVATKDTVNLALGIKPKPPTA